jgi:hypothetical protein
MRPIHGDGLSSTILFLSGFVSAVIEDEHGNPISNLPVEFEVLEPEIFPESMTCNPDMTKKAYFIPAAEPCLKTAPVWGACGDTTKQKLPVLTTHLGAQAEVMMGGVPYAGYPIRATCMDPQKCTDPATDELLRADFKHYTYSYNCSVELRMQSLFPTDPYGNNINAGKKGTQIPVMAKLYSLIDSGVSTSFETASVIFGSQTGTAEGQGVFRGLHTLESGLNRVDVRGSATMGGTTYTASVVIPVYGVDIVINTPALILLDRFGYAKGDTVIPFTIAPADYRALSAYMVILKNGEAIEYIPVETQGQGTATIGRGFWFDINSSYEAKIVLNSGTGVKIDSDKMPLKIIQFNLVKPTSDEKILIRNDSNGEPKMPQLTAQVELKGAGIDPTMIDTQQVKWKFSVEYLVDTNADSKKRARKGFDPTGAGQGKDGYKIPDPSNPDTPGVEYLPRQGSSFVIDETGSQGAKWGANFGGGRLVIETKTTLYGIEISDTAMQKIEGQRFSDEPGFKDKVVSYLNNPQADQTLPTVRGQLGNDYIFRVFAYKETNGDGRCEHFYPSKYGQPKYAIYPVENGGGDGGYGMMQLTRWGDPYIYPTYRQIWHWKENIDKGVSIVKDKLRESIDLYSEHPVEDTERAEFLRWNVYQLYNSGKDFWKWEYDEDEDTDLWVGYQNKSPYAWDAIRLESDASQLCQ